jgi:hypothetical protein
MTPGDFVSVLSHGLLVGPILTSEVSAALAHSPADIVRRLLIRLGVGTDPDDAQPWPVYASGEPSSPDSAITVYDTIGRQNGRIQTSGMQHEYHGVQVRVRAAAHTAGFAKARSIAVALDEDVYLTNVYIGAASYLVHSMMRTGDVIALGKSDSKRSIFTINALASLRQV